MERDKSPKGKEVRKMFALINIATNETYTHVATIEEAVELCQYFGNLRFAYMG